MIATNTPQVFATAVGEGWHDGVAVDACGAMYVPEYWSSRMYRVTSDGSVNIFFDWGAIDDSAYGHGAVFGHGIGGWREDAIYAPMPYDGNKVQEVVVGVPSRSWGGTVVNTP
jgi:hypothetical protein